MRKIFFIGLLVVSSVLLAGCGSAAASAGSTPSKPVNIKVESNPTPAMLGNLELVLTITDASGTPIEAAQVDVSADHTDMTGMTMGGTAADQGAGRYALHANFSMSGNWLLTVYVRKGDLDYKEDIEFSVQ